MNTAAQVNPAIDRAFHRHIRTYRIGQWLYRRCYRLYSPAYALYKKCADRFALHLFRQHLQSGATVLDIGANIGVITAEFARMVGPEGRVHAFEPETLNFERLRHRTASFPNVSAHRLAVAARTGVQTLYRSHFLNVDHRLYDDGAGRAREPIQALAIDDWFENQRVRLVKLDIQGFEWAALQGMRRTLRNNPDILLYLECWPYGLHRAGASVPQVLDLLSAAGFAVRMADAKRRQLVAIDQTPETWQSLARQPGVDFNLWCSKRM